MKRILGRVCVLVLLATAGLVSTTTPAQAAQGSAQALISWNPATRELRYGGVGLGWGSTSFYLEGYLYNSGVLQERITRSLCTGSCHLRDGLKTCPAAGIWKMDVWAFPTSGGYHSVNDVEPVTVI